MLTTRMAVSGDRDTLLGWLGAFHTVERFAADPVVVREHFLTVLADPALGAVIVFQHGGSDVGYAVATYGFDLEHGRTANLTDLYLDDEARGRGLGREALRVAEDALRQQGVRRLRVLVRPENHGALRLYVKGGFSRTPRLFLAKSL